MQIFVLRLVTDLHRNDFADLGEDDVRYLVTLCYSRHTSPILGQCK